MLLLFFYRLYTVWNREREREREREWASKRHCQRRQITNTRGGICAANAKIDRPVICSGMARQTHAQTTNNQWDYWESQHKMQRAGTRPTTRCKHDCRLSTSKLLHRPAAELYPMRNFLRTESGPMTRTTRSQRRRRQRRPRWMGGEKRKSNFTNIQSNALASFWVRSFARSLAVALQIVRRTRKSIFCVVLGRLTIRVALAKAMRRVLVRLRQRNMWCCLVCVYLSRCRGGVWRHKRTLNWAPQFGWSSSLACSVRSTHKTRTCETPSPLLPHTQHTRPQTRKQVHIRAHVRFQPLFSCDARLCWYVIFEWRCWRRWWWLC